MDPRTVKRTKPRGPAHPGLSNLQLDPEDEWLRDHLSLDPNGYARLTFGSLPLLHRAVLNAPEGLLVDHRNGDPLDNRKGNLRLVDRIVNGRNRKVGTRNTSGYLGVTWKAAKRKWAAQMGMPGGKTLYLGLYLTPEEANRARLLKEKELWGVEPQRLTAFLDAGIEVEVVGA